MPFALPAKVISMLKPLAAFVLLSAACGNADNVIVGGVAAGATTPNVLFDGIGSSIHGVATPRDASGNPVGDPMAVVIMSDRPNLCDRLKARPDYFRNAPEAYEALILFVRLGYLGTFVVGRESDPGTAAEVVAAGGPQPTTPFHGLNSSYISVTNWPASAGNATGGTASGSFSLVFDDPYGSNGAHPFYGRFKTSACPTLEGTLLP